MDLQNPYAPPAAPPAFAPPTDAAAGTMHTTELASREARFAANLVDNFVYGPGVIGGVVLGHAIRPENDDLGVVLVHHLTDALWPRHRKLWLSRWRLRAGVGGYHYYLTSHDREVARVQAGTPGKVLATQLGYDDARFSPLPTLNAEEQQRWGCDCIFIGHREPRTEEYLAALLRSHCRKRWKR